jgi:hypothetical protein
MDLKEAGCEDLDWTHLTHGSFPWRAPENMIMHLRVPIKMNNFLSNLTAISYSPTFRFHGVRFTV